MQLLDKPLNYKEQLHLTDMLHGNIARICTSDNKKEILTSLGFAIDRLALLAYSRTLELSKHNKAVSIKKARKSFETIRESFDSDSAYYSAELAMAFETLEKFLQES